MQPGRPTSFLTQCLVVGALRETVLVFHLGLLDKQGNIR